MSISVKLPNGVIFDTRSILISISGPVLWPFPDFGRSADDHRYRVSGRAGVFMGIAVTITSAALCLSGG